MRFSQTRPVKIVQLGAGGTGGHIPSPPQFPRGTNWAVSAGTAWVSAGPSGGPHPPRNRGRTPSPCVRRSGKTYYPPIGVVYPDVLEDTDKFPTELSCAEASVSVPQSGNRRGQPGGKVGGSQGTAVIADAHQHALQFGDGRRLDHLDYLVQCLGKFLRVYGCTRTYWKRRISFPRSCPAPRRRCRLPRVWRPTSPPPPLWWT